MNGSVTMYKVKPVFELPNGLDISSSMYKMKKIHGSNFISSTDYQDKLPNIMEQVNKLLKVYSNHIFFLSLYIFLNI